MGGNEGSAHHPLAAGELNQHRVREVLQKLTDVATSGACATIASDALMTPFDGKSPRGAVCLDIT